MRTVNEYGSLTNDELREELVQITATLALEYKDMGAMLADQHRDFLNDYIRSPGGSVAAKNRDAQYNSMDVTSQIIGKRAVINGLVLCRDLITFLLLSKEPGAIPFPTIASFDEDGLASA